MIADIARAVSRHGHDEDDEDDTSYLTPSRPSVALIIRRHK